MSKKRDFSPLAFVQLSYCFPNLKNSKEKGGGKKKGGFLVSYCIPLYLFFKKKLSVQVVGKECFFWYCNQYYINSSHIQLVHNKPLQVKRELAFFFADKKKQFKYFTKSALLSCQLNKLYNK